MADDLIPPVKAKLGADITEFKDGMADAKGEMASVESTSSSRFNSIAKGIGAGLAVAGAAVASFAVASVNKFAQTTQAIDDLQDITGESADAMSRLKYAFNSWGVSDDQMEASLKKLSKQVSSNADLFDQYGIAIKDAQGNTLPMSDIVANAADVFQNMPDGVEKSNLAMQLFGKSGTELLDVLNGGSEGLKAMGDEAEKFGLVLGEKDVAAAQENAKAQRQMHAAWEGFQLQLGKVLMPILAKVTTFLAEHMPAAIEAFKTVMATVGPIIERIAQFFGDLVQWVVNHWDQIKTTVQTGIGYVQDVISTVVGVIEALWGEFGDNLISAVDTAWGFISGIVDAAINIVRGIIDVVTGLISGDWGKVWDGIKKVFQGVWDGIKTYVQTAIDIVKNVIEGVVGAIEASWSTVWNGIKAVFTGIWDGIVGYINLQINAVKAIIEGIISGIAWTWSVIWNGVKTTAETVWSGIQTAVQTPIDAIKGFIDDVITKVTGMWDGIETAASNVWNGIKTTISGVVDGIKSKVSEIWNGVSSGFKSAVNGVIDLINKIIDGANKIPFVDIPHIPKLESGGTIVAPGLAIVGERGPELVKLPAGATVYPTGTGPAGIGGGGAHIELNFHGITDVPALTDAVGSEIAWQLKTRAA